MGAKHILLNHFSQRYPKLPENLDLTASLLPQSLFPLLSPARQSQLSLNLRMFKLPSRAPSKATYLRIQHLWLQLQLPPHYRSPRKIPLLNQS
jgi:hypothetical protein